METDDLSSYDPEKFEVHKTFNGDGTITTRIVEKKKKINLIKNIAQTAKELADGGFAEKSISDARWKICQACPRLNENNTCQLCGCFMTAKTKVAYAKCPEGRWGNLEESLPTGGAVWRGPSSERVDD